MEVYSPSLELLGLLETYDSLIIEDWAFKSGSFSLESIFNATTKTLLQPENIIWLEGETAGIIEFVQASASESGYTLSVKGSLLAGILSRRILWGTYALYDSTPKIMYDVVKDCAISPTKGLTAQRIIPNLVLYGDPPNDTRKIRKQSTGDVLTDFLSEIGQAGGVAYGVKFNAAALKMEFWARVGVDRTINQTAVDPVLYSTELDDVLSSEYSYDSSRYQNIALVAGEGEGESRKMTTVVRVGNSTEIPILPEGYTQIEYIKSTGQEYIDTGIAPTDDLMLSTTILIDKSGPYNRAAFGAAWNNKSFFLGIASENLIYFHSNGVSKPIPVDMATPISMECTVPRIVVNGVEYLMEGSGGNPSGQIRLFWVGSDEYPTRKGVLTLYWCKMTKNGEVVRDFIPCINPSGEVGLYDLVTDTFYNNGGAGAFVPGSEIIYQKEPGGFERRELYVDARDLQQLSLENPMTSEEYTEALTTRGQEKLSDTQLVQSFSATVRTFNPTYEYGVDFLLGDTITVTDERLGLSVSAVVEGVERSVGKNGEDMILTLGYGLPTISDRLRKAGV